MDIRPSTFWLLIYGILCLTWPGQCAPAPADLAAPTTETTAEITAALQKAAIACRVHPFDTEQNLAPFRALRDRCPDSILVQERYQDAVQTYGVEGELKALTEEYAALDKRQDDGTPPGSSLLYHYLYLRSLIGYSTEAAIQGLTEMTRQEPQFAPAHGSLAEIYGSAVFRDARKEKQERQTFLSLCPDCILSSVPPPQPPALSKPSPLLAQAEKLLAKQADPDAIISLTQAAIEADEWRWQHIHPHDWYSDEDKRSVLLDLRAAYWRAWSIQVRCLRRAGRADEASALLARMDQTAPAFQRVPEKITGGGRLYWEALVTLTTLYAEGKQPRVAKQKLALMRALLEKNPNPKDAAQVKKLQALVTKLN